MSPGPEVALQRAERALGVPLPSPFPSARRSTRRLCVSIFGGMHDNVDRRLLDSWEESRRHQSEARRFLDRQRFPVQPDEGRALEEIVATIADVERLRRSQLGTPPRPAAS